MAKPKSLDSTTVRGSNSHAQQGHKQPPLIEIKDESDKENNPAANTRSKTSKRSIKVDENPKLSTDKSSMSKPSTQSIRVNANPKHSDSKPSKSRSSKKRSMAVDANPTSSNDHSPTFAPKKMLKTKDQESPKPEKKKKKTDAHLSSTFAPTKSKTANHNPSSLDVEKLYEDYRRQDTAASRGPNGPPVYDTEGFELDPKLCGRSSTSRKPSYAQMERFYAKCDKSDEVKRRILKIDWMRYSPQMDSHVRDRVARDLGMQYHEVGLNALEEWGRRGFQLEEGFFEKITEEKERVGKLMCGCAFRKGYDGSW